jgi:hypothetical protein
MGGKITRTTLLHGRWEPESLPLDPRDVDVVRAKRRERRTGRPDPITGAPATEELSSGDLG